MNINEKKANYIANWLGINNGVIVNSGTIAIISALKILNIKPGDKVLINGYCCYSLFEAIVNVGAIPVIYKPQNFYNIKFEEIEDMLVKYNVKAFIATHQYGIVQNIKKIREKFPDLKIIEDIAQAWNIISEYTTVGTYSDIVVSSLGKTKPLSHGQAGIIMSNNNLHEYFDFHDKESRNMPRMLLPYALYECESINEKELVEKANSIVKKQKMIAYYLTEFFASEPRIDIHIDNIGDESIWHKFPVIIKDKNYIDEFEGILKKHNISFQWQNEREVWELDMAKNSDSIIIDQGKKPVYALIRTRQNEIDDIKKLIRRKK